MISLSCESTTLLRVPLRSRAWYESIVNATKNITPGWKVLAIDIIITDDEAVKKLNASYRGIDRVTDILSFNIPALTKEDSETGELYIALDQTRKQAKRYGVTLENEMQRLVIHGLLHLQGYDHMKVGERKIMRALEAKIRRALQ